MGEPVFEPLAEDPTSITFEPPKPLKLRKQRWETPGRSTGLHPAALIDYSDPDALKKAILRQAHRTARPLQTDRVFLTANSDTG